LVTHLLEAGARLTAKGDELRLQLCLDLPPTHANLEYLIEQKQVGVARYGERVPLSGERRDFIQEYALTDPQGKLLWYAHFHYPSPQAADEAFGAAHLKTREQQKLGGAVERKDVITPLRTSKPRSSASKATTHCWPRLTTPRPW